MINNHSTLIDEIDGMTVKENILDLVNESLRAIDEAHASVSRLDYNSALKASITAVTSAEKAFFDDSLVSLLYFPTEHKYVAILLII
jgi:phosphatidylinositol glycan class S